MRKVGTVRAIGGIAAAIIAFFAWLLPDPVARLFKLWAPAPQPIVVHVIHQDTAPVVQPPTNPSTPAGIGKNPHLQTAVPRVPRNPVHPSPDPPRSVHYLNPHLHAMHSGSWPWGVAVFGEARADDISSAVADVLSSRGREIVSLFRDRSAEQLVARDLFRGNGSLAAELHLARYCERLLIGRLSTLSLGETEGLVVAKATVTFRLLAPDGRIITDFEVTEKGGGLTDEAAVAAAVNALRNALPERMSAFL